MYVYMCIALLLVHFLTVSFWILFQSFTIYISMSNGKDYELVIIIFGRSTWHAWTKLDCWKF